MDVVYKTKNFPEVATAYKVFLVEQDESDVSAYTFVSRLPFNVGIQLKLGAWNKSTDETLRTNNGLYEYKSGFHTFKHKNSINREKLCFNQITIPVRIRKITSYGLNHGSYTYVSSEMMISKSDVVKAFKSLPKADVPSYDKSFIKYIDFCGTTFKIK